MAEVEVVDITGGALSPEERAIHNRYQDTDPDGDYYDPATDERTPR